jgi:hypothetical protein
LALARQSQFDVTILTVLGAMAGFALFSNLRRPHLRPARKLIVWIAFHVPQADLGEFYTRPEHMGGSHCNCRSDIGGVARNAWSGRLGGFRFAYPGQTVPCEIFDGSPLKSLQTQKPHWLLSASWQYRRSHIWPTAPTPTSQETSRCGLPRVRKPCKLRQQQ